MKNFTTIDTWIFDLDNTLYPRHCDLFSQIDIRMTEFMCEWTGLEPVAARKLQKELYRDHGTTLKGLMETTDVDPADFLSKVHAIDHTVLPKNQELGEMLVALPGRKLIYTNGTVEHAENTLMAMDVRPEIFDGIYDIIASDYEPKPKPAPFTKFMELYDVNGETSAMFEDLPRNLEPAKANGMTTVLIMPQNTENLSIENWEHVEANEPFIDHSTDDLDAFLRDVLSAT